MPRYALVDIGNNILREVESVEKPSDPIGKGWTWLLVEIPAPPTPGPDETLSAENVSIVDGVVVKTKTVVQIPINNKTVNSERDRRLEKKFIAVIPGPISISVCLDQESMEVLNVLTTEALKRIERGVNTDLVFRDEDNVNHTLSPTAMMDLFKVAFDQNQLIFAASWLIKDDPLGLPANLKQLRQDIRWP